MKSFYSKMCVGGILLVLFAGIHGYAGDQGKSGFFTDYLSQWNEVEKKLTDLAEAIPVEKYSWRPGEGVRSVQEVLVHVASANYYLPSMIGVKPPEGFSEDMEKTITEKSKAIKVLTESFAHFRQALNNMSEADLDKPAEFFGQKSDVRGMLLILLGHTHEHLGQLIAYARTNGVVPPWTAAREARKAEEEDEDE
jgi:uncharacterized damage-inducible protein DinB